jgi:hypothetical protein
MAGLSLPPLARIRDGVLVKAPTRPLTRREPEAVDRMQRLAVLVDRSPRDGLLVEIREQRLDVRGGYACRWRVTQRAHDPAERSSLASPVWHVRLGEQRAMVAQGGWLHILDGLQVVQPGAREIAERWLRWRLRVVRARARSRELQLCVGDELGNVPARLELRQGAVARSPGARRPRAVGSWGEPGVVAEPALRPAAVDAPPLDRPDGSAGAGPLDQQER